MKKYIDADRLKQTISANVYPVQDAFNSRDYGMFWTGGIEKAIDEQPTADVLEVKHGRWEDVEHAPNGLLYATCSVCGKRQTVEAVNYCGNCGADMREAKNGCDDCFI